MMRKMVKKRKTTNSLMAGALRMQYDGQVNAAAAARKAPDKRRSQIVRLGE